MSKRDFSIQYESRKPAPPSTLAPNEEYGLGIDSKGSVPHQLIRTVIQEETQKPVFHYSVRLHNLGLPNEDDVQNLHDKLIYGQTSKQSVKVEANKMAYQIFKTMNPHAYNGFNPGRWDQALTYYVTEDSFEHKKTRSLMIEAITPEEAAQRIQQDPSDGHLGLWRESMSLMGGRKNISIEDCTGVMSHHVGKKMLDVAREEGIPGICRYVPDNKKVLVDKHGYAFSSIEDFGTTLKVSKKEEESAIMEATKCDKISSRINIASIAAHRDNMDGLFPMAGDKNAEKTSEFLRTAALFLSTAHDDKIFYEFRMRYRR